MIIKQRQLFIAILFCILSIFRGYSQNIDVYEMLKSSPFLSKTLSINLSSLDSKEELKSYIDSLNLSKEEGVIELKNSNSTKIAISKLLDTEDKTLFAFVYTALEPILDSQIRIIDPDWNIYKKMVLKKEITKEDFIKKQIKE